MPFDDLLELQAFNLFPNGIMEIYQSDSKYPSRISFSNYRDHYTVTKTKVLLEDKDIISPEDLEKLKFNDKSLPCD